MTKSLKEVLEVAEQLPPGEQGEWAAHMLAELKDELLWQGQLRNTTPEQWKAMADRVRQQVQQGEAKPLDPDAL